MTIFKIHANSIILTPKARCIMVDIKDFYLNTPMKRPEYMRIKLSDIPEEIIDEYNLRELVDEEGYVYCEITKGMYGLPQAEIIAVGRAFGKTWLSSIKNRSRTLDA
jgi:hypothetical protein